MGSAKKQNLKPSTPPASATPIPAAQPTAANAPVATAPGKEPAPPAAAEETKKLTFDTLGALKPTELAVHGKKIVSVSKTLEKAQDKFAETLQFHAIVIAAMKRQYVDGLNTGLVIPATTFKKYFEQHCGGVVPGRVEALAALFNTVCLTKDADGNPLLSEENFMNAAVDWLEKANAIVNRAIKKHGDDWKSSADVKETLTALSKPGDALKKLKEIAKRQKEDGKSAVVTEIGDGTHAATLTVGRAIEFLKAALKDAQDNETGYALFVLLMELGDCTVEHPLQDKWSDRYQLAAENGVAPHILVGTPAEENAEENAEIKSLADLKLPASTEAEAAPATAEAPLELVA